LLLTDGADPKKMTVFDSKGGLHAKRDDIKADTRFYRKWELCEQTNPGFIDTMEEAMKGADVLIALSTPGPDVVKQDWIRSMNAKPIVFACSNPVPEIYPYAAKEAGAYIVATGRGDFPNQVNNSIGFPGILKGALTVRAKKITDNMAITAAHSLADFAEKRGINPENIVPTMDEADVFPVESADVAMQAIADGVARITMTRDEALEIARKDIKQSRDMFHHLMDNGFIKNPPDGMLDEAMQYAIGQVKK
jgi:malate dehydrogenase (oxaloacetate-decarboxylating)